MSSDLTKEYLTIIRKRYFNSSKRAKGWILTEFCQNSGLSRKQAIRRINGTETHNSKRGAARKYTDEAIRHLRKIWILMDQKCSKIMKAMLPLWIPDYECPAEVVIQLLSMSAATIDRKLKPFRSEIRRRYHSGTSRTRIKHIIPVKPLDYNVTGPGFVEADTVAHCGGSLSGEFIWSLTFTDIFSGWTENRAIFSKASIGVLNAIKVIEGRIPFSIRGFNVDNGSEFLSSPLIGYFGPHGEKKNILSRSREYRKNDNCHVEQKNFTHVRELFFYDRFSDVNLVPLMNDIYDDQRLLNNFFVPQVKLKYKIRVGAKYKRVYTPPATPYQRLIESNTLTEEEKERLSIQMADLNPFELRKRIQEKLKKFFKALKPKTDQSTTEEAA